MTTADFSLGLDFGTGSVRASLVRCTDGAEAGVGVRAYPRGVDGVVVDAADPELARQHPTDWLVAATEALGEALERASAFEGFAAERIRGIGVDTTASTPLPVDAAGRTLADDPRFAAQTAAMAWLWKDHTAASEAEEITELAREVHPERLERCGGAYSSEWFWAKVLRCARAYPEVFDAADSWVESCDYVTGWLTGRRKGRELARSACAAGHKALWAGDHGGLPSEEFLSRLDPRLAALRARLFDEVVASDVAVGGLDPEIARSLGLPAGIPVAAGAIDAHLGAVGAGVRPGVLVKVLGTSTCDMTVVEAGALPRIDGISGIAPDSIVPGLAGVEAGQAAVGDLYAWWRRTTGRPLEELEAESGVLAPGAHGLLALDWHNGNRCVLADSDLSGLLVGLNLQTTPAEIYRALVEATAFGARKIIDRIESRGVPVERVVACGGIAQRSRLAVQVHADVLGRPLEVAGSQETCALGAAIVGAVAGGVHPDVPSAQAAMCPPAERVHDPDPRAVRVMDRLYGLYGRLHDAFGGVRGSELGPVMKELLEIRRAARRAD